MEKKLYRVTADKKLCGVCTGFAKYFSMDITLVRLIFVLLALTTCGILAYIICALMIPEEPSDIIDA